MTSAVWYLHREENGDLYCVSGPRKGGADKLYGGVVQIDEDARVEDWTKIRGEPSLVTMTEYGGVRSAAIGSTHAPQRATSTHGPIDPMTDPDHVCVISRDASSRAPTSRTRA